MFQFIIVISSHHNVWYTYCTEEFIADIHEMRAVLIRWGWCGRNAVILVSESVLYQVLTTTLLRVDLRTIIGLIVITSP